MDSPFWEDNRKTDQEIMHLEALILSFIPKIKDENVKEEYLKHFNIVQHTHGEAREA
jgi:hypothetical protein